MRIKLFASTNTGQVRDHNEDNFVVCQDLAKKEWRFSGKNVIALSEMGALMVVADGMGGTNAGEVASDIAQNSIKAFFEKLKVVPNSHTAIKKAISASILHAHEEIVEHQNAHLETVGMGTTVVLCWLIDDSAHVGWVGDSRMYKFNRIKVFEPETDDDSLVWQLVKAGKLTAEESRTHPESNIITQYLGDYKSKPKVHTLTSKVEAGDRILLCSDGLNSMLPDERISAILEAEGNIENTVNELINAANVAGGTDNITVGLLDVIESNQPVISDNKGKQDAYPRNYKVWIVFAFLGALLLWLVLGNERSEEPISRPDSNSNTIENSIDGKEQKGKDEEKTTVDDVPSKDPNSRDGFKEDISKEADQSPTLSPINATYDENIMTEEVKMEESEEPVKGDSDVRPIMDPSPDVRKSTEIKTTDSTKNKNDSLNFSKDKKSDPDSLKNKKGKSELPELA